MSEENVELIRDGLAAFIEGDIERATQRVHPDVVSLRASPLPDARTYHGVEGMLQAREDWTADFSDFEMSAEEFIDAGDHVVVEIHQRAKGRASGAEVEGRFWFVYTIIDAKLTRQAFFATREQAFEAAGLRA